MAEQRVQGNVTVDGLGLLLGDTARRIDLPHAQVANLRGDAGSIVYGAAEVVLENLVGRLKGLDWATDSTSAGGFWLRDKQGRAEITIGRVELAHGMRVTRSAGGGVEMVAPHAALDDVKIAIPDLAALRPAPAAAPPPTTPPKDELPTLRQDRLRFLDAVRGDLAFRVRVVLDLPVLGTRTLDQTVKFDIKDGAFDYKKLDDGLTWLEGAFLDIDVEDDRFRVGWGVPLFSSKEIISWSLDEDALSLAAFDRIPLRCLADFRLPGGAAAARERDKDGGSKRLKSLTVSEIDVELSMEAPRNLDAVGGTIRFGGDDVAGIVDLRISGALVHPPGPGALEAEASALDMTLKDIRLGGVHLTTDRLTVGPVDALAVEFDGFQPKSLLAALHRVTASNLALVIGP